MSKYRQIPTAADLAESSIEIAVQILGRPKSYTVHHSTADREYARKLRLPEGCHMIMDSALLKFEWYVMDENGNKVGSRGP